MRLALLPLLVLVGCGGGHHASHVDHRYDRIAGAWSARCTASSGDYAGTAVGTTASFSVDHSGLLTGLSSMGSSLTVQMEPNGAAGFVGSHAISGGRTETVFMHLDTSPESGSIGDGSGSSQWTLTPITAPG